MGHLQELTQPLKSFTKLSPHPWKKIPTHVSEVVPTECAYQVRPGDSLVSISDKFGVPEKVLVQENPALANTSYPQLGVWMIISGAERGTENCQMKPKGFVASIKFVEPLSNLGFPMPKDTSKLTPAEEKLIVAERDMGLATKKADMSESRLHESKEVLRKTEALFTRGEKLEPEEIVQLVESMPLNNRSKDLKIIASKVTLCNVLLNHLESEGTLPTLPELDVAANNVIGGEVLLSPDLVTSLNRIYNSTKFHGSVTTVLKMNNSIEGIESTSSREKIERAFAKYFGVHVNQVALSPLESEEPRFKAVDGPRFTVTISQLDKSEVEVVKTSLNFFNITKLIKKIQSLGLEIDDDTLSVSKPIVSVVNKSSVGEAKKNRKLKSVIVALKHAKKDISARLKAKVKALLPVFKEEVAEANITLIAAESESESDKKKLQNAEKSVGKNLT